MEGMTQGNKKASIVGFHKFFLSNLPLARQLRPYSFILTFLFYFNFFSPLSFLFSPFFFFIFFPRGQNVKFLRQRILIQHPLAVPGPIG